MFAAYGSMTNAQIKRSVYTTEPMRFILKAENQGADMRNKPVLYKGKTARELDGKSEG